MLTKQQKAPQVTGEAALQLTGEPDMTPQEFEKGMQIMI